MFRREQQNSGRGENIAAVAETMPPDTRYPRGASIPRLRQLASDIVRVIPLLLVAALASLLFGANTVEIQAIWSLQRRSDRVDPADNGRGRERRRYSSRTKAAADRLQT
jgi:hypothetical protein